LQKKELEEQKQWKKETKGLIETKDDCTVPYSTARRTQTSPRLNSRHFSAGDGLSGVERTLHSLLHDNDATTKKQGRNKEAIFNQPSSDLSRDKEVVLAPTLASTAALKRIFCSHHTASGAAVPARARSLWVVTVRQ